MSRIRRSAALVPALLGVVVALLAGGVIAVTHDGDERSVAARPPVLRRPATPEATFPGFDGDLVLEPEAAAPPVAPFESPEAVAPSPASGLALPPTAAPAAPKRGGSPPAAPVVRRPPPRPNRSVAPAPAPAPGSPTGNAVHPSDFPDPFLHFANGAWFAYATQSGWTQVPLMRSVDLVHWQPIGDALRALPAWAEWGYAWAPSVLQRTNGFVLFYTTRERLTGLQCISRAVSVLPEGPFVDTSSGPIVCQRERGGSIDPSPYVDGDGTPWLLWKSEGTLEGEPTRLWSQRLSPDGLLLTGPGPYELLHTRAAWEGPIIEGPAMVRHGNRYHLFFSGNRWETAAYGVGHAVCDSMAGPCRRVREAPVFASTPGEAGPGSPEIVRDRRGELVLAYHSWTPPHVGYPSGARRLHLAALHFDGDRVVVANPRPRLPA